MEDGGGRRRFPLRDGGEPAELGLLEGAGVPSPPRQLGVAHQEVDRTVADRPLDRVGEQQAQPPAQQAGEVLGPALAP